MVPIWGVGVRHTRPGAQGGGKWRSSLRSGGQDAMRGIRGAPSAYSLCLMMLMTKVADFADAIRFEGKIAYYFEAGHARANEAQRYVGIIPLMGAPVVEHHRYATHAFLDKRVALPLQAADMYAWHLRHYYERRLDGFSEPRKDYMALSCPFDFQTLISHRHILGLRETFIHLAPLIEQGLSEEAAVVEQRILPSVRAAPNAGMDT